MISLAIATICMISSTGSLNRVKYDQVECQKFFVNCLDTKMKANNWTVISKPNSYPDSLLLECMKEQK